VALNPVIRKSHSLPRIYADLRGSRQATDPRSSAQSVTKKPCRHQRLRPLPPGLPKGTTSPPSSGSCASPGSSRSSRSSSSRKSVMSSNERYTEAKRTKPTWSSLRSSAITNSPTRREASSRSVVMRSWCTTARTAASICSSETGRLCSARSMLVRSLRASNGSRRPSPLMMTGSLSSIVSSVLKRSPQASHSRRRRIVAPSSDARESMTLVSWCWQKGQCIRRRGDSAVDRELPALLRHALAHPGKDGLVLGCIEYVADPVGQRRAVVLAIAAGSDRRRADAKARGDEGLLRIVGHGILVDRDMGLAQRFLGRLAGDRLADHVDQHQVVFGAAGDDAVAALDDHPGHRLCVLHHLRL